MARRDYRVIAGYFSLTVLLYVVFILGGFVSVGLESMGYIPAFGWTSFHADAYLDILASKSFLKATGFSLYLALVSTSLSTCLGVYFAQKLVFSQHNISNLCIEKTARVFMILPYLFVVYLVIFIGSGSGLLARVLFPLGLGVDLLYDPLGVSMILAYVVKGTPFVTLYVFAVMVKIKGEYGLVGRLLGASQRDIVRGIYVPLCKNAILWCSAVLFAYNLGAYEIPMLLTNAKQSTVSQMVYRLYTSSNMSDIPTAMAMNLLLLGISMVFGLLFVYLLSKLIDQSFRKTSLGQRV